jgi:hypothetical protein
MKNDINKKFHHQSLKRMTATIKSKRGVSREAQYFLQFVKDVVSVTGAMYVNEYHGKLHKTIWEITVITVKF